MSFPLGSFVQISTKNDFKMLCQTYEHKPEINGNYIKMNCFIFMLNIL